MNDIDEGDRVKCCFTGGIAGLIVSSLDEGVDRE